MSEQTTLQQQCLQDYQQHQANQQLNQVNISGQLGNAQAHGNEQAGAMGHGSLAPGIGQRY